MKLRCVRVLVAVLSLVMSKPAPAQDAVRRDLDTRFASCSWEFENMIGSYYLFDRGGNLRPSVDNVVDSARFGIMLYNPTGPGILRGNVEFLGEVFGGYIFHGPGDFLAGVSIFFRYNFVQPGARIVPYYQAGGGGVYTDIAHGAASGNAISQNLNFNLQSTFGIRFLINSQWSINLEQSYRHISNAGLSDPNYGIDQLGGAIGVGYSF
ncbi:MAG: acyloxyacyl hydrolase [Chthoniobacterales bacterium]